MSSTGNQALNPANQCLFDHLSNNAEYYETVNSADFPLVTALREACSSLCRYPRPLANTQDAIKLIGVDGDVIPVVERYFAPPSPKAKRARKAATPERAAAGGKRATPPKRAPTTPIRHITNGIAAIVRNNDVISSSPSGAIDLVSPAVPSTLRAPLPSSPPLSSPLLSSPPRSSPLLSSPQKRGEARAGEMRGDERAGRATAQAHIDVDELLRHVSDADFVYDDRPLSERLADRTTAQPPELPVAAPNTNGKDASSSISARSAAANATGAASRRRAQAAPEASSAVDHSGDVKTAVPAEDENTWQCSGCDRKLRFNPAVGWIGADGCVVSTGALEDWELVLLLDNREVRCRSDRTYLQCQLLGKGVSCETRQLPLGDMLWVLRRKGATRGALVAEDLVLPGVNSSHRTEPEAATAAGKTKKGKKEKPPDPLDSEFVLNYIIERKAVSDLAASIIDGRYNEQKLRLSTVSQRVTYIIEGDPTRLNEGAAYGAVIGSRHILTAMASTQITNQYRVVMTATVDATISWLVRMHHAIFQQMSRRTATVSPLAHAPTLLQAAAGSVLASPTTEHASAARLPADAIALSQTAAQMAELQAARTVWPIGGGMAAGATLAPATPGSACCCRVSKCQLWGHNALPKRVITYNEWSAIATKPRTMSILNIFGRMLRQVAGCGADRAQALLERYPTPSHLMAAYDALGDHTASGPGMLKGFQIPNQKNAIGPQLSSTMYDLFCKREYPAAATFLAGALERAQRSEGGTKEDSAEPGSRKAHAVRGRGSWRGGRGRGAVLARAHSS